DRGDRQRRDGGRGQAELGGPGEQLLGRAGADDPTEPDPAVGGGAHGAVLTGGVDGGRGPLRGGEVPGRPPRDRELRVPGRIAAGDPVVVLVEHAAVGGHEDGAEGFVAGDQRPL